MHACLPGYITSLPDIHSYYLVQGGTYVLSLHIFCQKLFVKFTIGLEFLSAYLCCIAGMLDMVYKKFGKFGKISLTCQAKTIKTTYTLIAICS